MKMKIGVSARHVHLSEEDLNILFGEGYELTEFRPLSQPGQYAANEKVTIKTEAGEFEGVRILGPTRPASQVEISKTDSFKLKINPPVKNSGDLEGASKITIVGPKGEVTRDAAIIANRHIHLTKADTEKYGLEGKEVISLKVEGEKGGILSNIHLRESESYACECHIDTDDANAFLIKNGDELEIYE